MEKRTKNKKIENKKQKEWKIHNKLKENEKLTKYV